MKHRIRFILLALLFLLSIAGCAGSRNGLNPTDADPAGASETPKPVKIASVDTSYYESAAVTQDGDLYMWGNGQPLPVKTMEGVQAVALGMDFYIVLKTDGTVWTWGGNTCGQIGNGNSPDSLLNEKEPVYIMDHVRQIDAGYQHALAVTESGDLYVWGDNSMGQVGDGNTKVGYGNVPENTQTTPKKIMSDIAQASASVMNTAAVTTSGELFCWGWNDYGTIGNGEYQTDPNGGNICVIEPLKVMSDVSAVALGATSSAAIDKNGSLYMWGDNTYGALGTGPADSGIVAAPQKVMDGIASVFPGISTFAIGTDGSLYAWGDNEFGNLGNGKSGDGDFGTLDAVTDTPEKVMDGVASASTYWHSLAVTQNGELFAWGSNFSGQVGNGETGAGDQPASESIVLSPVLVGFDPTVMAANNGTESSSNPGDAEETAANAVIAYPSAPADPSLNGARTYGRAVSDGQFVYVPAYERILKIDLQNNTVEFLDMKYPALQMVGVGYGYLYFSNYQQLFRVKTDGSGAEAYFEADGGVVGGQFTRYGDRIYCSLFIDANGEFASEDSVLDMQTGTVDAELPFLYAQASDSEYLYYALDNQIMRCSPEGGPAEPVATASGTISDIVVSGGWIYYGLTDGFSLYRYNLETTEHQQLQGIAAQCFNVAGPYIFYGNLVDEGKLYRANTDGTNPEKLRDASGNMVEIDVCMGRVFFDCEVYIDEETTSYTNYYASILPDGSNLIEDSFLY